MKPITERLWAKQDRHFGDRIGLFDAVTETLDISSALYPGSFVDIAASFVIPAVTYVDIDRRARQFFADTSGVDELIAGNATDDRPRSFRFVARDYRDDLGLGDSSFDLLISLYAGFISEHCTHYLRVGGSLLVNPSHGDAAMAAIDDRYELRAVVKSAKDHYWLDTRDLGEYLVPKKAEPITADLLHQRGRGVAYTKPAFAYIFERVL